MTLLPELREAQQLHRLRGLRVQRAREQIVLAQRAAEQAAAVVQDRQRRIEQVRRRIDALVHAVAFELGAQLPRWTQTTSAQREYLADRLERDEYALIGEQRKLEAALEGVQQARAGLTRALAREDAVGGLVHQTRQARQLLREQRAERELEDQPPLGRLRPA